MNTGTPPNRLIHEKSPYLLQHAYNPVNWYPWGEEAFQKASREDKPIFLSIGYSSCHWCHVMEKESFEDTEVAQLLNEIFVCIKVDREERPDIDSVYMAVCQVMTGKGGWPLTVVMTPDKKPFFAATYIPKESRFGLVGIVDLLPRIEALWKGERKKVLESAEGIISVLEGSAVSKSKELDISLLKSAYEELRLKFDEKYGGFGSAPKFPLPHNILFLLRYWKRFRDRKALDMVEKTMEFMRLGGIWDHVGLGIHRYSTDQFWLVPHFEKMLYDQALLALACAESFQATGNDAYKHMADQILGYVLRDMTSPEGGFYTGEDADSEGEEGKFYTWDEEEVVTAIGEEMAQVFSMRRETSQIESGKNILYLRKTVPELALEMNIPTEELDRRIEESRKILFEIREKRVHPGKDEKILTDWNGLFIAALSRAANVFGMEIYSTAAQKAADFILEKMLDSHLYHRYYQDDVAIPGFVDDYAFFVWGLIELYEATFYVKYLQYAVNLTEYMVNHFYDENEGGFYMVSDRSEHVLVRQKRSYDGALPSGNSVAALNLLRLARMTGTTRFEEKAAQLFTAFSGEVDKVPSSHTFLLTALDFAVGPSFEVVIVGNRNSPDTHKMIAELRKIFVPSKVVIHRPDEKSPEITNLSLFTADLVALDGRTTVYVCRDYMCSSPITDVTSLMSLFHEDG
ncbi:MAG: thioredoxin domain-containing protein [Theionarchaea archaeon]|nr:thioredoxin domain-containing protein [Theionarchaea archaeon]